MTHLLNRYLHELCSAWCIFITAFSISATWWAS